MKLTDKISKVNLMLLLAWYFLSLYIVTQDNTMTFGMMLSFEIINTLMIIFLSRVLLFSYRNPSFTDFAVSFCMVFWFIFSTIRDYHEVGYSPFLKMFYLTIDLLSLSFLIDTFFNFISSSGILIISQRSILNIDRILRVTVFSAVIFIYCHLYKGIR